MTGLATLYPRRNLIPPQRPTCLRTPRECTKLARPEGFEPPTAWFVARYSIQLSYGRVFCDLRSMVGESCRVNPPELLFSRLVKKTFKRVLITRNQPGNTERFTDG